MARDLERIELMFRRQLALESMKPSRRHMIARLDPISSCAGRRQRGIAATIPSPRDRTLPNEPDKHLTPSTGYFNTARVAQEAVNWLFVVGHASRRKLSDLISKICHIQASKRTFRPIFVLDDPDHIELMRLYGFTFEVVCADSYMGLTRAEQIDVFKAKWGASLTMDLNNAKLTA